MAYLPGQVLKPTAAAFCDHHPERPSVHQIVGETDSFGSEFIEMCQDCYAAFKLYRDDDNNRPDCDSCGKEKSAAPHRDPSEGSAGPVYYWCSGCYKKVVDHFVGDDNSSDPQFDHDDYPGIDGLDDEEKIDGPDDEDDGALYGDAILTNASSIRELQDVVTLLDDTHYKFRGVYSDGKSRRGLTRFVRRKLGGEKLVLRFCVIHSANDFEELFQRRIASEEMGDRARIDRPSDRCAELVVDFGIRFDDTRYGMLRQMRGLIGLAYALQNAFVGDDEWKLSEKGIVRL